MKNQPALFVVLFVMHLLVSGCIIDRYEHAECVAGSSIMSCRDNHYMPRCNREALPGCHIEVRCTSDAGGNDGGEDLDTESTQICREYCVGSLIPCGLLTTKKECVSPYHCEWAVWN